MRTMVIAAIVGMALLGLMELRAGEKMVQCAKQMQTLRLEVAEMRGQNPPVTEAEIAEWLTAQVGECRSVLGHKH